MSQSRAQTTPLFRTSLRDWQAAFKAKQAEEAPPTPVAEVAPTRVKRLAARKKKKMRDAMLDSGK